MILIACVDDKNGIMFNNRRQSIDKILREEVLKLSGKTKLWMNEYTASQFENRKNLCVDNDFMSMAENGEYCFIEGSFPMEYYSKIEEIVLFKWNTVYPADVYFTVPSEKVIIKNEIRNFEGNSHKKITMEVFR